MWQRLRHVFDETPVLFFAVVIGVAFTFRLGVGLARDAATPPVVAPTFVTTGPEPGLASGIVPSERPSGASAPATTATASAVEGGVGAAAKVQPIGTPSPPRVAPKPRGHGRRPPRTE